VAILLILWLVFGIASAMIAKDKNRSFGDFFVLGVLLGPIGLIIALCSQRWYYDEDLGITGSAKYLHERSMAELDLDDFDEGDEPASGSLQSTGHADELRKLANLHESGHLSDAEFSAAKAQLLGL
jgi:hypothetical protein